MSWQGIDNVTAFTSGLTLTSCLGPKGKKIIHSDVVLRRLQPLTVVQFHKISGIKVDARTMPRERILDEEADAVGGLSTRGELFRRRWLAAAVANQI